MIGSLSGVIREKRPPRLLLDVGGVGYELEAPMNTFYTLPDVGSQVTVATHLVVREDAQLLYAFGHRRDRDMFRHLLKVNGVGPRMALAVFSSMSTDEFIACVSAEDAKQLTRVPGIGQKTADRLMIEMRGRLDEFDQTRESDSPQVTTVNPDGSTSSQLSVAHEAVSALVALGYKPNDASRVIRGIDTEDRRAEEVIRDALQAIGSRP